MTIATLKALLDTLDGHDERDVLFRIGDTDIGAGYHVTEIKQAKVRSIDCAARISEWQESQMQLLDGSAGDYMPAGRLAWIIGKAEDALPGILSAPLSIEFSPGNQGLGKYTIASMHEDDNRMIVALQADRANCKPIMEILSAGQTASCCGQTASCCG